ncbi:tryptophan--tRNA ligase [Isachenkonia alkalipeptolytica]|uniref:Tryptophan--tRNA ligase n=1 Tax=Isachenkonia alkalipeptolytica TaxID=2565777 RepID=A0AA43XJJ6_9CLOT|nr:tryptophan--tRNA ligase [Isachenkonia alkalipeptolytica]NBG87414.1 tryptophan--tRNA ligase [Isachenkonia alkalipeptolytica]
MNKQKQKVIFSGAQPTGSLTLGNYIGAVSNWKKLQEEYDSFFSIVDLHSLTVRQDPKEFYKTSLSFFAQYLAAGLDPEKNTIFFQSQVKEHSELAWILSCNTYLGELNRMTQFKEKSEKHKNNINAGLFTYPVLQAADILLYDTHLVPVGEDQKQHLELSRDIALRFNNHYGETFEVPEVFIPKAGARIMSLQEPEKKMSKSDENQQGTIFLMDEDKVIEKKIKRAVTDSENEINYREEQPGVKNLINIYATMEGISIEAAMAHFEGEGYGKLKKDVAEVTVAHLQPFKEEYRRYMENPDHLLKVSKRGAEKARERSEKTMERVKDRLGLIR